MPTSLVSSSSGGVEGDYLCTKRGIFEHPSGCGKYVKCSGKDTVGAMLRCPSGWRFDEVVGKCLEGLGDGCEEEESGWWLWVLVAAMVVGCVLLCCLLPLLLCWWLKNKKQKVVASGVIHRIRKNCCSTL